MGHENCVFLALYCKTLTYNKQHISLSIPKVKQLHTTISSWEHTVMAMDYKFAHKKNYLKNLR